jgi:hypothetical protein
MINYKKELGNLDKQFYTQDLDAASFGDPDEKTVRKVRESTNEKVYSMALPSP